MQRRQRGPTALPPGACPQADTLGVPQGLPAVGLGLGSLLESEKTAKRGFQYYRVCVCLSVCLSFCLYVLGSQWL